MVAIIAGAIKGSIVKILQERGFPQAQSLPVGSGETVNSITPVRTVAVDEEIEVKCRLRGLISHFCPISRVIVGVG